MKEQENERRTSYKSQRNELEQEIAQLKTRLQSSPDIHTIENEKIQQTEEQYQLVADRLQNQRLILVSRKFIVTTFRS